MVISIEIMSMSTGDYQNRKGCNGKTYVCRVGNIADHSIVKTLDGKIIHLKNIVHRVENVS